MSAAPEHLVEYVARIMSGPILERHGVTFEDAHPGWRAWVRRQARDRLDDTTVLELATRAFDADEAKMNARVDGLANELAEARAANSGYESI